MKSCLIIAGEKSGEEHAASFLPQVITNKTNTNFFGVGGEYLESLGVDLLFHLRDFSSWGYSEVIGKIPFYLRALKKIENECIKRNCTNAILIDFQEFNLMLAKRLSKRGIKIFYYVAPQAWVWKSWRVATLKKYCDTLFTILPFEKMWFNQRGVRNVISVPHPIYLKYRNKKTSPHQGKAGVVSTNNISSRDVIKVGLFPGSRLSEIKYQLPIFLNSIKKMMTKDRLKVYLVYPEHLGVKSVQKYTREFNNFFHIELVSNLSMERVFSSIDVAIATSGTINLTLAYFCIPTIVCYKSSLINEFIFNTFIKYRGPVSLPNIIWDKKIFPELLQNDVTEYNICYHLKKWISILNSETHLLDVEFKELQEKLKASSFDVSDFLIKELV